MNDIKARMKSVTGTMQITKAMELVANSKLRRAKDRVESSRPFYEVMRNAIASLEGAGDFSSPFTQKAENGKTLYIVVAGDRGLAGGYNSSVFKLAERLSKDSDAVFLPIGKKAFEYFKARDAKLFSDKMSLAAETGVGTALSLGELIVNSFIAKEITSVKLVYTKFVSMISQLPVYEEILPLDFCESECENREPLIEEDSDEMLLKIVPQYLGGLIYSAIAESVASEHGARRAAMNAANKNAEEMLDTLMLKFNRARQAIITQEITEIVSGADAL